MRFEWPSCVAPCFCSQQTRRQKSAFLTVQSCAADDEAVTSNTDEDAVVNNDKPRGVVAEGMERFEIGVDRKSQPPWEKLSPRTCCVLGGNPSAYTLNGTNCYLIGAGKSRLLVDAGEKHYGNRCGVRL